MSDDSSFEEIVRHLGDLAPFSETPEWLSGSCSERPRYIEVECVLDLYDGSQLSWIVKVWGGSTVRQFAEGFCQAISNSEFINFTDCEGTEQVVRSSFMMKFSARETR